MSDNLISVIIPCYNKVETIGDCIDSILGQSGVSMEIIVIDDASDDGSKDIIRAYNSKVYMINTARTIRKGVCFSRNGGASYASGEHIIFFDADCVAEPEMLAKMSCILDLNNTIDFVYCNYRRKGVLNEQWRTEKRLGEKKAAKSSVFKGLPFDVNALCQSNYISTMSLARRAIIGKWDADIKRLNDWDFWLGLALKGHKGFWIDKVLFTAYYKEGDISLQGMDDYGEWARKVAQKHYWAQLRKAEEGI